MIRLFHFVLYICCYSSDINCTSSLLFILPTDHNYTSCPRNNCYTLNDLTESGLSLKLFTNQTTLALLPGFHIIRTARNVLVMEKINSIFFISVNGKASVRCMNRFTFKFKNIERIEISNIDFKSCTSLYFLQGRNIKISNITIEQGKVNISLDLEADPWLCFPSKSLIHLYNLNVTSNNTGIYYYDGTQVCIDECDSDFISSALSLQNITLNMANIVINAKCTQIYMQKVAIRQICRPFDHEYRALAIYDATEVILSDISIEDNNTPSSLLEVNESYAIVDLKGHIRFWGNKNCRKLASFNKLHSLTMLPHCRVEFYGNTQIHDNLLEFHSYDSHYFSVMIGGYQLNTNTSILFKNNELTCGGSLMVIATDDAEMTQYSRTSPFVAQNLKFVFVDNIIHCHSGFNDVAVSLFFQSTIYFANISMLFVNNSVLTGGIFVMVQSTLHLEDSFHAKFEYNKGSDGGAMAFYGSCIKRGYKEASAHFILRNNIAQERGGAIFIKDFEYIENLRYNQRFYT